MSNEKKAVLDIVSNASMQIGDYTAYSVVTALQKGKERTEGIATPFNLLDVEIPCGEITLIAGSTGHCKTTALISLVHHIKKTTKGKVLFYSVEEQPDNIAYRLVSSALYLNDLDYNVVINDNISVKKIRERVKNKDSQLEETANTLNYCTIIDCSSQITKENDIVQLEPYTQITRDIKKRLDEDKDIKAVIIDYLQITAGLDTNKSRDQAISDAMKHYRSLLHEDENKDLLFIMGIQLNREHEKSFTTPKKTGDVTVDKIREQTRPRTYHMRDGGSEQWASLILSLNYPCRHYYDGIDNEIIDIHVVKNRYGEAGQYSTCTVYPSHSVIVPGGKAEDINPSIMKWEEN